MSLRSRLTWAFVGLVGGVLILTIVGLNVGMYLSMHMNPSHMAAMADGEWMVGMLIMHWSLRVGTVALLLAIGLAFWTSGRITRSLQHLRDAASRLALRDLSLRVPVEGNDEIADLARTFNRMGERLAAEERSRRQLLADVAHELRHPLAVLQGRLELLQDGVTPFDSEAVMRLQDEVLRLGRLTGDLRDLSLAEVGGLSLHRVPVQVADLLEGLLADLQPVAAARGLTLQMQAAPDLPRVEADPGRMRQVFVNLVANALQYTPSGGVVTLRAHGAVYIEVRDTGPGISPEELPYLFDRFYRGDRARSRGGSGLGLAIVRSLVELHGGRVEVSSELGKGTCFTVFWPAARDASR